jgi:DNA (cytosine-5)-methyltransferase 1
VWDPSDFQGVTLLAGGVPCPPFSRAGRQLGANDERDLFAWAVKTVEQVQPAAVMLENVRGLNDARFGGYRQAVVDEFERMGYVANWEMVEARDHGVPQLRPRLVLVALRPDYAPYFEWPEPKPTTATVGSTLADLMGRDGFRYLDEWVERANAIAPTIVGGSKKHGGADLGPTRAKRAWQALWVDAHGLADEPPSERWDKDLHPRGPRLTVEMVARLQGWHGRDYAWEFKGGKTSRYRQIGNAFPPPVARAIGDSIARALRKEGAADPSGSERRMHDEVYRLLRDSDRWLTAARVGELLGKQLTVADVERRIGMLGQDFVVEVKRTGSQQAYKLGEWKAFRGQDAHHRHIAFGERRTRARIS